MDCSILIPARNAASTIARALTSALQVPSCPVLLIDDWSDDDTVSRAQAVAGTRLTVVRPPAHGSLGFTRQCGLDALSTRYGIWLDADDEMLPGRVARLLNRLREGADFATDEAEIVMGSAAPATARLPGFLFHPPGAVRLFERMYLPVPGPIGFRTHVARRLGYDASLHGPEDTDLLLRALAGGCRIAMVRDVGYRIHASPGSISRNVSNQRAMVKRLLAKHAYSDVEALYSRAGADSYVQAWGLCWIATQREDYSAAEHYLERAAGAVQAEQTVVEPDGPCPKPEGWRLAFQRGTLHLLKGDLDRAASQLERAGHFARAAESANNLGVALRRLGRNGEAATCFRLALEEFPDYLDARMNAEDESEARVTPLPLRRHLARWDYTPPAPPGRSCRDAPNGGNAP